MRLVVCVGFCMPLVMRVCVRIGLGLVVSVALRVSLIMRVGLAVRLGIASPSSCASRSSCASSCERAKELGMLCRTC